MTAPAAAGVRTHGSWQPDVILAALADPTRRGLLEQLALGGEATASSLARSLPISRQAVVKHLVILRTAGLVTGRRAGREVRFAVQTDSVAATAHWLAGLAEEWDGRLAQIKRLAEAGPDG